MHLDTAHRAVSEYPRLMKIPVIAAQDIRVPAFGGLHHIKVIGVAQGSVIGRMEKDDLRDIL